MLIDGTPQHVAATAPWIVGTEQWTVPVIDSSNSGHGPSDSRADARGRFRTGVGRGTLRLFVSADGIFAGYSWSTLAASRFIPVAERALAIGRLNGSIRPGLGRRGRNDVDHGEDDLDPNGETIEP
jgi:hypothetical protein